MAVKLTIAQKLFLAILAAIVTMVIGMQLSIRWSFERGFSRYVTALEQERFEALAVKLEAAYGTEGDWRFIQEQPALWAALLLATLPEDSGTMRQQRRLTRMLQGPEMMHQPMMQHGPRPFELRVVLLDANKKTIWGPRASLAPNGLRPLTTGAQTVGYLGLLPAGEPTDPRQLDFVQRHKWTMTLVAIFTALAAALLCIPLARRLARPVSTLAEGTRALARGQYSVRLPVVSSDELGQLTQDFNLLAEALEENETDRKQWVADISHELRTPLSILRGEIEALQDGIRTATPSQLDSLHGEVLHLVRLVEDLYELSMSDIGALTYRKEPVDFRAIVSDVIELYRPRLAEKGLTLTADLCDRPVILEADAQRLQQLIENLLENSLRYTDAGGALMISLGSDTTTATLQLQDTAPGVSEQELPRLFERLYRVEASRTRGSGGAGLGLSICKNIVHAHGGSIDAKHSELGGIWTTVRLPVRG